MFNSTDIQHMRAQGLDLASYDDVRTHAADIYQQTAMGNMPPGSPWPADYVTTFLNWMNAKYPKGRPAQNGVQARFAAQSYDASVRVRKEITMLTPAELDLLKTAFAGIIAKGVSDPNSYFVQAGYHWYPAPNTYCMHHVPGYNPWHRAYMLSFEDALRSVAGCEKVTLPYWDITTPFPEVLKNPPFDKYTLPEAVSPNYPKGYVTQRFPYDQIQQNLIQYGVTDDINRALSKTDWEDFHGLFGGAPYDTIIAAHDSGHNSIGPTMQDQGVAAFDPVFWFFHCNWDRLFWQWQTQMDATDLNGLISTIDKTSDPLSYQLFTDPALGVLNPFTAPPLKLKATTIVDSVKSLKVAYLQPPNAAAATVQTRTSTFAMASDQFAVSTDRVNVTVSGVNRLKIPGSFSVHLTKDGKVIASKGFFQPTDVETCETCIQNAVVRFDFELPLSAVQGGKLGVWVEPADKSFVGNRFPNKLMGDPTVEVRLLVSTE
jgi:hypothetical protein